MPQDVIDDAIDRAASGPEPYPYPGSPNSTTSSEMFAPLKAAAELTYIFTSNESESGQ